MQDLGTPSNLTSPALVAGAVIGTGAIRVLATQLLARLGIAGPGVVAFLRTFGTGVLVKWNSLPGWVKAILTTVGFTSGLDFIFDDDGPGDDTGIVPSPIADPVLPTGGPGTVVIVGSWMANGIRFYRLNDGRFAVKNKHGRWKIWRAPKPIMLTSSGASNIKTFIKADAALDRQAKKLKAALGRRGAAPKPRCSTCGYVYCRCLDKVGPRRGK